MPMRWYDWTRNQRSHNKILHCIVKCNIPEVSNIFNAYLKSKYVNKQKQKSSKLDLTDT